MRTPSLLCLRVLNVVGAVYVLALTFCLFHVDIFYLCPAYYATDQANSDDHPAFSDCSVPTVAGCFIMCQMLINFILFHYCMRNNKAQALLKTTLRYPGNGYTPMSSDGQKSKHCERCQMMVPIRCYHCPVCGYCVLKKDHHCFVVGGCVGYGNQRYFIVFIFWAFVGSAYGILYMLRYLNRFYQPLFSPSIFLYFGPVALSAWLFAGKITFYHMALVFLLNLAGTGFISSAAFLVGQFFFMVDDRTMWERMKFRHQDHVIPRYFLPFGRRLRTVFGPWCLLNFLMPLPFKNELDPSFKHYVEENDLKIV